MTDAGGSGPPPEQLRETLMKKTVPDLIKTCKAAGLKGYSNKRREELIDLLVLNDVFKKPRLDEQVARWMPPICAVCSLRSLSFCSLPGHSWNHAGASACTTCCSTASSYRT